MSHIKRCPRGLLEFDDFGKPTFKQLGRNVASCVVALAHAKKALKQSLVEFKEGTGMAYEDYIVLPQGERLRLRKAADQAEGAL